MPQQGLATLAEGIYAMLSLFLYCHGSTNIFLKQRSGRKLCCMCLCTLIITLSNVQINEMKNANISLSPLYWR